MPRLLLLLSAAVALLAATPSSASAPAPTHRILSVALDGTDLRELATGGHAAQARDGRIAFFGSGGLTVMAEDGTAQRFVTAAGAMEDYSMEPAWSARGEIGFGRWAACAQSGWGCTTGVLMVADAATGAVREVARSRFRGVGSFSWAPRGGRIAYLGEYDSDGSRMHKTLEVVRADGTGRSVLTRVPPREGYGLFAPAWSPRGDWIAYRRIVHRRSDSLWLVRPEGGAPRQLVPGRGAVWSPTGDRLLYTSGHNLRTIDVSTRRVRLLARAAGISAVAWSPDGRRVAFATPARLHVVRAADGRPLHEFDVAGEVGKLFFSRDGSRLIYGSSTG